jgi:hypothetical protein
MKKYGLFPETDIQCDPWEIFTLTYLGLGLLQIMIMPLITFKAYL